MKRQDTHCKHAVGSVAIDAFFLNVVVNTFQKFRVKIATTVFHCAEPDEFRIIPIIIGCSDFDPKESVIIAIFKVWRFATPSMKLKIGTMLWVVPVNDLVSDPSFVFFFIHPDEFRLTTARPERRGENPTMVFIAKYCGALLAAQTHSCGSQNFDVSASSSFRL